VTYYYVQHEGPRYAQGGQQAPAKPGKPGQQGGYGTVNSSAPDSQFPATQEGFVQPGPAGSAAGPSSGEESALPPPTYQQAVGDHKVQKP
jgi:hypothetical protein